MKFDRKNVLLCVIGNLGQKFSLAIDKVLPDQGEVGDLMEREIRGQARYFGVGHSTQNVHTDGGHREGTVQPV